MHTRRRSIAFKFETTGTNSVRVQRRRGAYVWVQRAACLANHAKSQTYRRHPKTQSMEQGPPCRAKAPATSQTGLGNPHDLALFIIAIDSKLRGCDLGCIAVLTLPPMRGNAASAIAARASGRFVRTADLHAD
jgi:hypothetical protein